MDLKKAMDELEVIMAEGEIKQKLTTLGAFAVPEAGFSQGKKMWFLFIEL